MPLDLRLQVGDQLGVARLESPTAPTRGRSVAAAGHAHERTGLPLAQPPLAGVVGYLPPGRGGDYFFRKTSLITWFSRLNSA